MTGTSVLVRCDGCGQLVPRDKLRRCRNCGAILCPSCRKQHVCSDGVETSAPSSANVNSKDVNAAAAASASNNSWNKYRYSDSGCWIFPPESKYLTQSHQQTVNKYSAAVTANPGKSRNVAKAKISFDIGKTYFAEIFEISDTEALLDTDITLEHETALYLLQEESVILTLEPGAHTSSQIVETKVRNHEFDPDKYTEVCLTRIIPIKIPCNVLIHQNSEKPSIIHQIKGIASISVANPIVIQREYLSNHSFVLIDVIQKDIIGDIEKSLNEIAMEFTLEKLQSGELSITGLSSNLTQKCFVTLGKKIDARAEIRGLKVSFSDIEIDLTAEAKELIAVKKTSDLNQSSANDTTESGALSLFEETDELPVKGE